jgi:flagellar secretion chaperone FliS
MTPGEKNASTYLRTRVLSAPPEELRLLLLDGAIKFLRQGRDGLARKDFEASFNGISQCRDILVELMTSINSDPDPDLAERVRSLYGFMYSELIAAKLDKDLAKMDKVIGLLEFERETWLLLIEKLAKERSGSGAGPSPSAAPAKLNGAATLSLQA